MTQSAFCRLDHVLLTFGHLYYSFLQFSREADAQAQSAVMNSLALRWSRADQSVFLASVLLHPLCGRNLFANNDHFTPVTLYNMLAGLWICFFSQPPPSIFRSNFTDYLQGRNLFSGFQDWTRMGALEAKQAVSLITIKNT